MSVRNTVYSRNRNIHSYLKWARNNWDEGKGKNLKRMSVVSDSTSVLKELPHHHQGRNQFTWCNVPEDPNINTSTLEGPCIIFCNIYTFQRDTQCSCTDCLLILRCQLYMFRTVTVHPQELLFRCCMCRLWYVLIRPAGTTFEERCISLECIYIDTLFTAPRNSVPEC